MSRLNRALVVSLCVLLFGSIAPAQEEDMQYLEDLTLYVGQPKTIQTLNPTRVAVAKPEVVDVHSVTNKEVVLQPKSPGNTTLFIWDDYGKQAYRLKVYGEDLSPLKERADVLIRESGVRGVYIKANEAEGRLILLGEVDDIKDRERLLTALGGMKDNILDLVTIREENAVVKIDIQILEIKRDDIKQLGINIPDSTLLTDNANKAMNKITDMFATSRWTRAALNTTINHLASVGKLRVLSEPKLVCLSGKEASFLVGGQVPVITTSSTSTNTSENVTYKDYGINLKIKPVVKNGDNIYVSVGTEVSEIDSANKVGNVPAFTTRNTQTELYLKDEQSLIISGLIKNREANTVEKFPGLGDIPVLGMLFRSRDFQRNQTELVILITPSIVNRTEVAQGRAVVQEKALLKNMYEQDNLRARVLSDRFSESVSGLDLYIEEIKSLIATTVAYPAVASEYGFKGTVTLRLRILSNGELKNVFVVGSSGSGLLDKAAVSAVKQLSPFPPFPTSVDTNEISIEMPLVYS